MSLVNEGALPPDDRDERQEQDEARGRAEKTERTKGEQR